MKDDQSSLQTCINIRPNKLLSAFIFSALLFLLCHCAYYGYLVREMPSILLSWNFSLSSLSKNDEYVNFKVQPKGLLARNLMLPNLSNIEWPIPQVSQLPSGRRLQDNSRSYLPPEFEPVFSANQRKLSYKLLKAFSSKMYENDLGDRFMIYGGTLLGSFRHHDFIPWDDDVDLFVDINVRDLVRKIFRSNDDSYLQYNEGIIDKLYTKILSTENDTEVDVEQSRKTSEYVWGWPYLDIFFYSSNKTHIFDMKDKLCYPKSIVFPLYFRPFGNNWYPAPKDPLTFLNYGNFHGSLCETGYSHVIQRPMLKKIIKCENLSHKYAFVEHTIENLIKYQTLNCLNNGRSKKFLNKLVLGKENLVIRTKNINRVIIHSIKLPVPYHNTQVETYGLEYRK